MENTLKVLRRARDMVAAGWCQGSAARNSAGTPVSAASDDACQFCLYGAVARAAWYLRDFDAEGTAICAIRLAGEIDGGLIRWNDQPSRTQADVVNLLDLAIGRLE
jgi:hypothetical protein